jgi:hypothetical protein
MLVRNLRRPGDAARAQLAYNDQLRIEIANDNRISKIRENQKKGIPEAPSQEQQLNLSERIGDANQRRQKSFDNLSQVFAPDQVDRIMPLLDDNAFQFLNVYWKDMKSDLTKKVDAKLMDELYFQGYFNKYMNSIMDQKGLNAPTGTQASVNEIEELLSLFTWKDEGQKVFERMSKVDTEAANELGELLKLVPDRRRIERIRSLPDEEKQRVVDTLNNAFRGIETNPNKWNKALQKSSNQEFFITTVPLYRNMTEKQRQFAEAMNDYLNDPLADTDPSLFGEPGLTEPELTQPKAKKGKPAEEPKPNLKGKKGKLPEAEEVKGDQKIVPVEELANARSIDQSDYMSPNDFDREEKGMVGKQVAYINLLKQTDALPDRLKTQLFYNKETGGQYSMEHYKKPRSEGAENRTFFWSKLVNFDKQIKFAFEQKEKEGKEQKEKETADSGIKRKPGRPKSGQGIASTCKEQTPRWIELGRYRINGRLLDEKQLLSVRYQSGTAVPLFPKMIPISDAFHELLTNLFETKKLDKRLLKELDPEEQRSAEALLVKSGVGRGFGIKEITPTDEEAKKIKRFEIVKGSYLAGNNSKDVIHELRSLIIHFVTTGHLSRKEGLRTLVELQ